MSELHSCAECNWCHSLTDSEGDIVHICVNRYSDNFLQEVGLCSEGCELDDFAERLWCEEHGVEYEEDEDDDEIDD